MNPLYDHKSMSAYDNMKDRIANTKGRDQKQLSASVEARRKLEKEWRSEKQEMDELALRTRNEEMKIRVKSAGARGRDEKSLSDETEQRRSVMQERSAAALAGVRNEWSAEAKIAKDRIREAGGAPRTQFVLSREVELRREQEEALRLLRRSEIAERIMRDGVNYKRTLSRVAAKGGRDSKELSDVVLEHGKQVQQWRQDVKMGEAERIQQENLEMKMRIHQASTAPSGDERAKEDSAANFVKKLMAEKRRELEAQALKSRNSKIRQGNFTRLTDHKSRPVKEAEAEAAMIRKAAEEKWLSENRGFLSAIAMVPTSTKHALGMSGAAGKDAKELEPAVEQARHEFEEIRARKKVEEAARLEEQNQEMHRRLAKVQPQGKNKLSPEVEASRKEAARAREGRKNVQLSELERANEAEAKRLRELQMFRDGTLDLPPPKTSPGGEWRRATSASTDVYDAEAMGEEGLGRSMTIAGMHGGVMGSPITMAVSGPRGSLSSVGLASRGSPLRPSTSMM